MKLNKILTEILATIVAIGMGLTFGVIWCLILAFLLTPDILSFIREKIIWFVV